MLVLLPILLVGVPAAWNAANGETPIASDEGQHQGIDTLANVMNTEYTGDVFYEHWLGWELRYYLGADPQVYLLYFETPDDLIQHAQVELPTIPVPRYFVAPLNQTAPWIAAMESRGLQAEPVYDDGRYAIYALTMLLEDPGRDAASSECPDGTC
jgi:hypothetical protein